MAAPNLETSTRVLIVEGYSDLLFYAEMLESVGVSDVFIKQLGGKGNFKGARRADDLATSLETFLSPALLAAKRSIGVIVDADDEPTRTATSLSGRLSKISTQEVRPGEWTSGSPRVGFFVVPAKDRVGELETLVWDAWSSDPDNTAAKTCVDAFLGCMASGGHAPQSPDKARVSALLAVRYDEDPRLGPGARAKVFDLGRPQFGALLEFLRGFG